MEAANWKKPLALAALLAGGGLLVYWFEFSHRPAKEEASEQAKKLFALKDRPVDTVFITDGAGRSFFFRCVDHALKLCKAGDQSKWQLEQPSKQGADPSNVNALLSALNNLVATDSLDLKSEPEEKRAALLRDYGLAPEARAAAKRVEIQFVDGKDNVIAYFGAASPIDQGLYTLVGRDGKPEETRVILTPSHFAGNFNHDLTYWRDKKVLTLDPSKLTGFELKGSRDHVVGERKDGQWTLSSRKRPGSSSAGDLENVDGLITTAHYLLAKDFPKRDVLKTAKHVLDLTLRAPEPVELRVYQKAPSTPNGPDGKAYVTLRGSDVIYEIEASSVPRLDKALKDLRQTKLLSSLDRFAVKRMEFSGKQLGPKPIVVSMEGSKWMVAEKDNPASQTEADPEKAQTFLDKISGNQIEDFLEAGKIPQGEKEGITVLLTDEKGEKPKQFVFWPRDFKLYGRDLLSKRNEAFIVNTSVSGAIPWAKNFFDKKKDPNPVPTATR